MLQQSLSFACMVLSLGVLVPCASAQAHGLEPVAAELRVPITLEGFVVEASGAPAEGAVVVSSAGGQAVSDRNGRYWLEVHSTPSTQRVQVTAIGRSGGSQVVSTGVDVTPATRLASVGTLVLPSLGSCAPGWTPTFGGSPGLDGAVQSLTVFDDGGGPALYVGGSFTAAGGVIASRIVRWDGSSWTPLGSGMNGPVQALAVFDDGGGAALYAGGSFTDAGGVSANRVAKWNGSTWAALGSGTGSTVGALCVFDDGGGPALFVGGSFTSAGGAPANGIAKWNGSTWSTLGSGVGPFGAVWALTVFDPGGGPALYAGGSFTNAGGVSANRVARWDGSSWSALGSGVNAIVSALCVFDDGSGPALFVGGDFTTAGGAAASRIAKWNGASWSALGTGVNSTVRALSVVDLGGGAALCVSGNFSQAGGGAASHIASWDGAAWSALGGGLGSTSGASALQVFDDGSGPVLYAGGTLWEAGGRPVWNLAQWDGASWTAFGSGLSGAVYSVTVFDDGGGPALYVGGNFVEAGGVTVNRIARWGGTSWSALGSGVSTNVVYALTVFDDGSGPALYAGGDFQQASGVLVRGIAKWDGSSWSALGSGLSGEPVDLVNGLAVFDDGSGPALFATGGFTHAGGVLVNHVAKWDGASWSALGSGLDNYGIALTVFDDGTGPALYVGGTFTGAGAALARRIARWDGASWSALGVGMTNNHVASLTVFDDGSGPALYAGGGFTTLSGVAANRIAKWDGSSWSALGSGLTGDSFVDVHGLKVFDDGSGPALYAGGRFTSAGGVPANNIARWDGSSWSPLGSGVYAQEPWVEALAVFDDGSGPALHVGGQFVSVPDSEDSLLAKWSGCPDSVAPTIFCPAQVLAVDGFSSPPGEVVHFTVTAVDNLDPAPVVVCVPPSGSFFPQGTTLVNCTATDALGNQSTCQFAVRVEPKAKQGARD